MATPLPGLRPKTALAALAALTTSASAWAPAVRAVPPRPAQVLAELARCAGAGPPAAAFRVRLDRPSPGGRGRVLQEARLTVRGDATEGAEWRMGPPAEASASPRPWRVAEHDAPLWLALAAPPRPLERSALPSVLRRAGLATHRTAYAHAGGHVAWVLGADPGDVDGNGRVAPVAQLQLARDGGCPWRTVERAGPVAGWLGVPRDAWVRVRWGSAPSTGDEISPTRQRRPRAVTLRLEALPLGAGPPAPYATLTLEPLPAPTHPPSAPEPP